MSGAGVPGGTPRPIGDTGSHARRRPRSPHRHRQSHHRRAARVVPAPRRHRPRGPPGHRRRRCPHLGRLLVRGAVAPPRHRGGAARGGGSRHRPDGHHRDGQAVRPGQGRGGQVRPRVPVVRRARRGDAGRPRGTRRRVARPRRLPAARGDPGRDALELPDVAGGPLHRPGRHGRQRGPAQARPERAPHGAAARGPVPPGRRARRRAPGAAHRHRPGPGRSSPTTGWRR